ncbi:MarR family transcriptional regulator [Rossellomorea marisflavi]|uniref:MarR family winged helix-turn-helix transcriptional regulator n=1 Tax=Rossellomorea TaxID=2837508 RepID=UPI000ACE1D29|nr:MarR family transcriptional regulator [Rossellomorea marisflavi]VXB06657.1 putative transcriptional regulator (MarR family) [Bacillus sp. 349Y]MCM2589026.1 MarR family transcriptional regulator [Rossellomorea marisflavi]MDR4936991.1 MarR family transcriptional regulator [Rossellomorea marisflavi]MDW4526675.1 MarR family transcriptional regulator [Rossellomorea marisflavi]UTE70927.1 MarR family transcriptional regulator [Rossellomorea marisflavi]
MPNHCSEEGKIIYQLNDIYKLMSPKFERCTGISQSRLELLHKLFDVDEISQTQLQKEVCIDGAAVTRHLKQLEAQGMVSRRKNPADNRFTFVRLTKEGREKIDSFKREKEQFISRVLDGFSEAEMKNLSDSLSRIQDNVNKINY